MNKAIVSLVVLGAVAISAPAFAKSAANVPTKGAKITASKLACKSSAHLKHKAGKTSLQKIK